MNLVLANPQQKILEIVEFLRQTYQHTGKQRAVIAVSGGIDSAVAVTLLTQALGSAAVRPVLLPYGEQDLGDGEAVLKFNQLPQENWQVKDIKSSVDEVARVARVAGVSLVEKVRLGNLMARVRMMLVYDLAKKYQALVCGTENKSEKYLGYFTRFGDEASDIEPIVGLYKTQVRQLAEFLNLPAQVLTKPPTAGLWAGQTDEAELGFSYEVADQVLAQLIDQGKDPVKIQLSGVEPQQAATLVAKVVARVKQMEFKQRVPYLLE